MKQLSRRLSQGLGVLALLGVGYFGGQYRSEQLVAQPKGDVKQVSANEPAGADQRVVAYVNGNESVSRAEFGEYLIKIYGKQRIRLFMNTRIIEAAATKRGLRVTPEEIDAQIKIDCDKMKVSPKEFATTIVKQRYGKTIDEWRTEVLYPRLLLLAMVKDQFKYDDAELKKMYDYFYGEKVIAKVILYPVDQEKNISKEYNQYRNDDKAFDAAARSQVSSDLASRGGLVDPIGRYSPKSTAKIEEIAFALKDGQVSEMISTPAGIIVVKRIRLLPADSGKSFEAVKPQLVAELRERQEEELIPQMYRKVYEEAKPVFIFTPPDVTKDEMEEQSRRLLNADPSKLQPKK